MIENPNVIQGGVFSDNRGAIRFVNGFRFSDVKRFYIIKHPDVSIVRAWQGHQFEKKYFYPVRGSFVVAWVKVDNFYEPSMDLTPDFHILSDQTSEIISIPKGYANGLLALEPNSEIMVLSDKNLEDSLREKIRFPAEWWLDWRQFSRGEAGGLAKRQA